MLGRWATSHMLRARYEAIWHRPWPWDNTFLRVLTREASSVAEALILMRQDHEFTPDPSPPDPITHQTPPPTTANTP